MYGRVAEWLGRGLQNLVQRFESARDLQYLINPDSNRTGVYFFILISVLFKVINQCPNQ